MPRTRLTLIVPLLVFVPAAHAQPAATFQGLGKFNGEFLTWGTVVSDVGPVVGGVFSWFDGEYVSRLGFTWTPSGGFNETIFPGEVRGISASGENLVGQYHIHIGPGGGGGPEDYVGYFGTPAGVTHVFHHPEGVVCSGISADGAIAIGSAPGPWYRWPHSGFISLPVPSGFGRTSGVSGNGAVVVGHITPQSPVVRRAVRWHNSSMEFISGIPGVETIESEAIDISRDGRIIVGYVETPTGTRAVRAPEDRIFRALPLPPGATYSRATATNADGNVVVGWSTATHIGEKDGFIWTRSAGMRDLKQRLLQWGAHNVADWTYLDVRDISGDGRYIVGTGRNPQNQPEAFLATIPPFCYANCDNSFTAPILNIDDFTCFINRFAANDPYANCDNSTTAPVLNVDDFTCFINLFAAGCPE